MTSTNPQRPSPRLDRPQVLNNHTCLYCWQPLVRATATEEHVIGRKFVPKGALAKRWNLVAACCMPCNQRKAALENDLSAILLQPTAFGEFPTDDALLAAEASRKGTARHPTTGEAVRDSSSSISVSVEASPQFSMAAQFTGPPTVDPKRAAELAWHHVTAFFYLGTFDQSVQSGRVMPGTFDVLDHALRTDWGNDIQRGFATAIAVWPFMFGVRTAGGFFKAVLRKHPSAHCIAWALEWNMNLRIVGMFGDAKASDKFAAELPNLKYLDLPSSPRERLRFREERTLEESEDRLFCWDEEPAPRTAMTSAE